MGKLKVRFGRGVNETGAAAVPLEIIGADMRRLEGPRLLRLDRELAVTVAAGAYLVRAHLPSGELVSAQVEVGAGESKRVVLTPVSKSPSEALGWAYYTQPVARSGLAWGTGPALRHWAGAVVAAAGGTRPVPDDAGPDVQEAAPPRLNLWAHDLTRGWVEESIPPHSLSTSPRREDPRLLAHLSLSLPLGQRWLHLSPDEPARDPGRAASKFVAMPAAPRGVEALVMYDPAPGGADPLNVLVRGADPQAEAVLAYLTEGAFAAARSVAGEVVDRAKAWLGEGDPISATIAGYYLLRAGWAEQSKLPDWIEDLAGGTSWLPDGSVIHAWCLLRRPQADQGLARGQLIEAERRGLPLFTQGLRLLLDGLGLVDRLSKRGDAEVRDALDHLRPYAAAADWSTATTTFFGPHPNDPRPLGAPLREG